MYVTMVMEHDGDIIQAFRVGPTELESWDYDPRRSAEMSVDMFGVMLESWPPRRLSKHLVSYLVQGPKLAMSNIS